MTETAKLEARESSIAAAWDFIGPKLSEMNLEKGLAGVWSNGYRSGWDAAERALARPEVKGLEWREEISGTWWTADAYRVEVFDGGGFAARVSHPQSRSFRTIAYGVSFEAAKAAAQSDFEQRILSSLSPPTGEMVLVPKSALDWLNGEGPDANGHHFGDAPDDFPKGRAFWWRTKFRALIDDPLPSPPEAE